MVHKWHARYFDGRSAAVHQVSIELGATGLHIRDGDGTTATWRYDHIRCTQGKYDGEQVRLEYEGNPTKSVVVNDQRLLTALRARSPKLLFSLHDPGKRAIRFQLTVLAVVLTVLLGGALYRWGIPGLAAGMTPYVPISWEQALGEQVVNEFAKEKDRCENPARQAVLDSLVTKLASSDSHNPYGGIHLHIVDRPVVNAFAAPGGFIVVYRGLLEKTESPEQFAGVLAHEIQHILKRHTTRTLLEQFSTSLLVTALSGDFTGVSTFVLSGAQLLGSLQYSRGHEEEADTEGTKMLIRAGIDPSGLVEFFRIMGKDEHGNAGVGTYLSTHPSHKDRASKLSSLASEVPGLKYRLLAESEWTTVRAICQHRKLKEATEDAGASVRER